MSGVMCDLAIIGGGLSGGLIALAARRARPDRRVLLIEAAPTLGGAHLWSFLDSDVEAEDRPLLEPLVNYGWREFAVVFPLYKRALPFPFYSIRSDRFDAALREAMPAESILTGRRALGVAPDGVVLEDGTLIGAGGVIDARGPGDLSLLDLHYRKFVGYELTLDGPHSVRRATLIDAAADPAEGFQYMEMLPIENDRLFIEDVRYESWPEMDMADHGNRIVNHAARFGWRIRSSARGQAGVLPIALGGDFADYWRSGGEGVAKAGLRAGLFHPVTGNSLADAARVARLVAEADDWSGAALHAMLHDHAARAWAKRAYYRRFATRMLRDTPPAEGYRMLESLYAMDADLIARFHAMRLGFADRMALSLGEGPMPVGAMFRR
ncbi:lycopene cyclase [Rhizorhabdus wittichii DC-6]|jgi:lycopene beta-cyclase|uniref:Lycopene cyclase n=2 Tax=Rhizorhabdus wittichii TaxID=160791 RepID=A0A9J9HDP1_RHIWR|nr:lycopene beta-cyclase CrtY [Rhizorhabdus wittichii]ABQ69547.1 lycopene cyclase [Rhizorhabdus wittichii RW1]ARR53647.1 lycopene cyclase [Rhizorhabdus wittichii DC-6]QTH19960.1 lycopene beta-cyclase CrtY [Rhizorhabdus wittichii]